MVMLYKVVITALDAVVLYTKVGIVLKNIITNTTASKAVITTVYSITT